MRLTNLKGLYYFYRVAQRSSVKVAAEELFVTQAAVSQQLRILEESLGEPLFLRKHRGITLTETGKRLLPYAQQAFEALATGLQEISSDPNPTSLTISVLPSFASRWLVPRLGDFYRQFPEFALMLKTDDQLETFENGQIDLALRYGSGDYPLVESRLLMPDYVYPVCHPLYFQQQEIHEVSDLNHCTLLSDAEPEPNFSWPEWLASEAMLPSNKQTVYTGAHYVTEATLAGQGVALLRHSLVADLIAAGSLVRLFDRVEALRYSNFACAPAHYFKREKIKIFVGWLEEQINLFKSQHNLLEQQ